MSSGTCVFVYRCRNCGEKFESTLVRCPYGQTARGFLVLQSRDPAVETHKCDGLNYGLGELVGLRDEVK